MKKIIINFLGFTALHFLVSFAGAMLLIYALGSSLPQVVILFMTVLAAGVTFGGLPNTVVGWFINSLAYGFLFTAGFHISKRRFRRKANDVA